MSDLPEGWARSKLGDVAQARMGKTILSKQLVERGLPVFSASVGYEPWGYTDQRDVVFSKGTLVVSARGTIGDVKVPDFDEFVSTQTTIAIVPTEILISRFLQCQLQGYDWPSVTATTAIPMLTIAKLDQIDVVLPPVSEQRRIVAKLDALAARTARARAHLDRIPTLASRYKQIVLSKAFSGELTAAWRLKRATGEPKPSRLADLVSAPIRNGLSVRGSDDPPGVRSLRLSALRGRQVNMDDVRFLPISSDKADRFLLEEGDILISRGNGTKALVGICALVPPIKSPTIFPDTAFRLRAARDRVVPRWLTYIWSAPQVRAQVEAIAKTTAGIWKVSQGDLARIELTLVDKEEQVEIVRRVDAAFAEIDRLATEAAAARRLLDRLDQAIMAKAFRGELVPQDPADEPANVLLERICTERAAAPKAKRGRPSRLGNNEVEAA